MSPSDRQDNRYQGRCHCATVRFEVVLVDGFETARRCNCSMCRMRGAVALAAPREMFQIVEGEDALSLYRFNTGVAEHYFCSHCGIYTHHRRRSNPDEYGVNAACLDGVSPFDFESVAVTDGIEHVRDREPGARSRIVGRLRYESIDA